MSTVVTASVVGFVLDALGLVACIYRVPFLLNLFTALCGVSFFVNGLALQSVPLVWPWIMHFPLAYCALELRNKVVPLWFSTGTTRTRGRNMS